MGWTGYSKGGFRTTLLPLDKQLWDASSAGRTRRHEFVHKLLLNPPPGIDNIIQSTSELYFGSVNWHRICRAPLIVCSWCCSRPNRNFPLCQQRTDIIDLNPEFVPPYMIPAALPSLPLSVVVQLN